MVAVYLDRLARKTQASNLRIHQHRHQVCQLYETVSRTPPLSAQEPLPLPLLALQRTTLHRRLFLAVDRREALPFPDCLADQHLQMSRTTNRKTPPLTKQLQSVRDPPRPLVLLFQSAVDLCQKSAPRLSSVLHLLLLLARLMCPKSLILQTTRRSHLPPVLLAVRLQVLP
jgi:hypothetical protein